MLQKSLALAYLELAMAEPGTALEIEILGAPAAPPPSSPIPPTTLKTTTCAHEATMCASQPGHLTSVTWLIQSDVLALYLVVP